VRIASVTAPRLDVIRLPKLQLSHSSSSRTTLNVGDFEIYSHIQDDHGDQKLIFKTEKKRESPSLSTEKSDVAPLPK
jgi:hypothetical protein